ncbi:MAG: hypothetical protein IJR47_05420, partial [Clostridia bacterium]|nr:hypothetical protein [Clostridia bacterium]
MNKFKKSLSQVLSFMVVFALAFSFGKVSLAENEGTIGETVGKIVSLFGAGNVAGEDSYTTVNISSAAQLRDNLGQNTSGEETAGKIYVLQNDIDMSSVSNFRPVLEFRGVFRGNGKTISNLNINTTETDAPANTTDQAGNKDETRRNCIGFVRVLAANAKIENVTFNNYTLTDKLATAGMVAGRSYGIIDNVYIMGTSGLNTNSNTLTAIGGLVGEYYKVRTRINDGSTTATNPEYPTGSITNCTFAGYIRKNNAQLTGTNNNVGGLIGVNKATSANPADSTDITALYWDMSKTPGVTQPIGGSGT